MKDQCEWSGSFTTTLTSLLVFLRCCLKLTCAADTTCKPLTSWRKARWPWDISDTNAVITHILKPRTAHSSTQTVHMYRVHSSQRVKASVRQQSCWPTAKLNTISLCGVTLGVHGHHLLFRFTCTSKSLKLNQPTNQPINQPTNQPTNQSTYQLTN